MKKILYSLILMMSVVGGYAGERLVVLHTNDTHSQIEPDEKGRGGILRRAALVDSVRKSEKNVLLIDAGDVVQGTPYFSLFGGEVEFAMIDSLGYDMIILGNHEFDNGIDSVAYFYKRTRPLKISANYDFSGTPLDGIFLPYTIKEYNGKKIAFIGANLNPKGIIADYNVKGVKYSDPITVVDDLAGKLKSNGVDMVVVVSHIGYDLNNANLVDDVKMIGASHNIDLVIGGHSHTLIDPNDSSTPASRIANADGRMIPVAQTGKSGRSVGEIYINLDDMSVEAKMLPVDSRYDSLIRTSLSEYLAPYKAKVDELMNRVIAQSAMEMSNRNDAIQNWTSDAAMEIAKGFYSQPIDLAIMNKGGIRKDMPKGDVSEGLINAMFPFDNKLVVMKISGKDLLDAFQVMAVRNGDALSRSAYVVYDDNKNIRYASVGDVPVDPEAEYTLLTLDYLAQGNDYMVPLTNGKIVAECPVRFGKQMVEYVKSLGAKGKYIGAPRNARMVKCVPRKH